MSESPAQGIFGAVHGGEEIAKGAYGLWSGEEGAPADLAAGAGDLFQGAVAAASAASEYGAGKIPGLDAFTGLIGAVGGISKMVGAENDEQLAEGAGQTTFGALHTGLGIAEDMVAGAMAADAAGMAAATGAGAVATVGTAGAAAPVAVPVAAAADAVGAVGEGGLAALELGLDAADVAVSGTEMGLDVVGALTGMGSANSMVGNLELSAGRGLKSAGSALASGAASLWDHFAA